jgi:hypothetical protein
MPVSVPVAIVVCVVDATDAGGIFVSVVIRNHANIRRCRIRIQVPISVGFHSGAAGANQSEDGY